MKQPYILVLASFLFLLISCRDNKSPGSNFSEDGTEQPFGADIADAGRDLEDIQEEGVLRVLTTYSSTSYFLYRGRPMGYEYELLQRFADYLDVDLDIRISRSIDQMIHELNTTDVDLLAHGITITSDRKKRIRFTDYLYLTHQVLVQKKPDNWRSMRWGAIQKSLVHDVIELIGDTVSVRNNSSYQKRLVNLSNEIGGKIFIDTLSGSLSTDEIIKMVVDGDIKYTVADNNIASINESYYPVLNIDVPVSFSQRIAWAVSPGSTELLKTANQWLAEMKDNVDYYVIYNKYFKNKRHFRKRIQSEFYSLNNNRISKYDDLIRKYAEKINWDWRLLASQVYQESRFLPGASSWASAKGLMQLMPATARELGVKDRTDPEDNLRGGSRYVHKLWKRFDDIPDSIQRIKFSMAAYNCGFEHVQDARRLAEHLELNPDLWDENVEDMMVKLSFPQNYNLDFIKYGYVRGEEPYTYVDQIFKRYNHYLKFIEK